MKSKPIVALVAAALLLVYPVLSYAWSSERGGHYYRPAPRTSYHHNHSSGNDVVPYLVGGLVLGGILAAVLSQPSYASTPSTPSYTYPTASYEAQQPPGEWVHVPGRWVEGRWVPEHNVWVPVNP